MTRRALSVLAVLAVLAGCATTSAPPRPAVSVPDAWREASKPAHASVPLEWWRAFNSAELANLIGAAIAGSPDLAAASERVKQAEAQVRVAGASLFPTLDLGITSVRRDTNADQGPAISVDTTNGVLNASYEIDLWGRLASGVRSAESTRAARRVRRGSPRHSTPSASGVAPFNHLSHHCNSLIARCTLFQWPRMPCGMPA